MSVATYSNPNICKIHNRRKLQQKGTRSAKRRLKAMSGREKRFMKDTNHCVSKKLANQPGVAVFVLEDLSSIRTQRRGKKMNKWLGSWAFYQQEQFLTYKAEALGKRVAHQDPRYTSQKCNICKHIRRTNRHKSKFHCKNCGHRTHADLNAAKNVRDDYVRFVHSKRVEILRDEWQGKEPDNRDSNLTTE